MSWSPKEERQKLVKSAVKGLVKMKTDPSLTQQQAQSYRSRIGQFQSIQQNQDPDSVGGALRRPDNIYGLGHKSALTMNDIHHHLREVNTYQRENEKRKPNHNAHALMMRHNYDFDKGGALVPQTSVLGVADNNPLGPMLNFGMNMIAPIPRPDITKKLGIPIV